MIRVLEQHFFYQDFRQLDVILARHFMRFYPHVFHLVNRCLDERQFFAYSKTLLFNLAHHELFIYAQFEKARDHLNQYIQGFDSKKEAAQKLRVAAAYTLLGIAYHRLNEFKKTIETFHEADRRYQDLKKVDATLLKTVNYWHAHNYANRARVCQDTAENEQCLQSFQDAVKLYVQSTIQETKWIEAITMNVRLELLFEEVRQGLKTPAKAMEEAKPMEINNAVLNESNQPALSTRTTPLIVARIKVMLARLYCSLETKKNRQYANQLLDSAEGVITTILGPHHFELIHVFFVQLQLYPLYPDYTNCYQRAVNLLTAASLNKTHLLFSRLNLMMGRIYYNLGYPAQALRCYQEAVLPYEGAEKNPSLPSTHPALAVLHNVMGEALRIQGEMSSARLAYDKYYANCKELYSENHYHCFIGLNNLGELYLSQLALKKAETSLYQAWLGIKRFFGDYHIYTLTVYTNLIRCRFLQGQYSDLYHSSDIIFESINKTKEEGYDPLLVMDIMYHYGRLYLELRHYDLAQLFLEKSKELIIKGYSSHPRYTQVASELMVVYAYQDDFKQAIERMKSAKNVFKNLAWLTYPDYLNFLVNVMQVLYLAEGHEKSNEVQAIKQLFTIDNPSLFLCDIIKKYQSYGESYFVIELIKAKFLLSQLYEKQHHYKNAIDTLEEIIGMMQGKVSENYHGHAEVYYGLAQGHQLLALAQDTTSNVYLNYRQASQKYLRHYQGMKRVIYSETVIHLTKKLKARHLFGFITVQTLEQQLDIVRVSDDIDFIDRKRSKIPLSVTKNFTTMHHQKIKGIFCPS